MTFQKTLILVLSLFTFAAADCHAQDASRPVPRKRVKNSKPAIAEEQPENKHENRGQDVTALNAGFQLGFNLGTASISSTVAPVSGTTITTTDPSAHAGLMLGGNIEYGFTRMFFLQAELNYVKKGVSIHTSATNAGVAVTGSTTDEVDNLNYMALTLLAKAKFGHGSLVPNVFLGPDLGFLLSATRSLTPASSTTATDSDIKANFSGADFAFDFGAGLEYPLLEVADIFLSMRYSLGLSNVQTQPTTASWKTRGFQVLFGLEFALF